MSIFKEAKQKAVDNLKRAQTEEGRKMLELGRKWNEDQAKKLTELKRRNTELKELMEPQFQQAKELLQSINAQGLLQEIKRDVWKIGKVTFDPGDSLVLTENDPIIIWPCVKLSAVKDRDKTQLGAGGYYETHGPTRGGYVSEWVDTGFELDQYRTFVGSFLTIKAVFQDTELGLIISRDNRAFRAKYGSKEEPEQQYRYSPNFLGDNGVFLAASTPNPQETVIDILKRIVYEDTQLKQLPKDFIPRTLKLIKSEARKA